MTIHLITTDTTTSITANTSGDTWILMPGVSVASIGDCFNGNGVNGDKTFMIHGGLASEQDGIDIGDAASSTGGNNTVHIFSEGWIFAKDHAIESSGGYLNLVNDGNLVSRTETILADDGNNFISNRGMVTSSAHAIYVTGELNVVANSGTVTANGVGIYINGAYADVQNSGKVESSSIGIYGGASGVTIENSGTVHARGNAIQTTDSALIVNTGTIISSDWWGVIAYGDHNGIFNTGTISGASRGIVVLGSENRISNEGVIFNSTPVGNATAIDIVSGIGAVNRLVNTGTISGHLNALIAGDGMETIVNRGIMEGDVDLGYGSDAFRGRNGSVEGVIYGKGGNDLIVGGISDDVIAGNSGNDDLRGNDGDDVITGGNGHDVMRGGAGYDIFEFDKISESVVGGLRDRIVDFVRGEDIVDLLDIDAMPDAGDQAFHFIGEDPFSNTAGELRAVGLASGNTIVAADVDGDGRADFQILLVGVTGMTAADFIL